jgi:hypothetical protein
MAKPLPLRFDRSVHLEFQFAHLSCSGPLMARAVAIARCGGTVYFSTAPAALSSSPTWNGYHTFCLPSSCTEDHLVIDVEDAITGRFLGRGRLSLCRGPDESSFQVMLEPRFDATGSPLAEDQELLSRYIVDDFGYICGRVRCAKVPSAPPGTLVAHPQAMLPPNVRYPIGCALRVTWLSNDADLGRFALQAVFGKSGQFTVSGANTLFVSVGSVDDCVVTLQATHVVGATGHTLSAQFRLPLHLIGVQALLAVPIESDKSTLQGLLLVTLALTATPDIPPAPVSRDFGRAPPDVPAALFHPPAWESEEHVARSTERRWRKSVLLEAAPQQEHIRHVFDAVAGRTELSPSLLPLLRAFFNLPNDAAPMTCDLRQLLVGMAFTSQTLDPRDAALFVFDAVSTAGKLTANDLAFVLEHTLLPKTLDCTTSEIQAMSADILTSYAALLPHTQVGLTIETFDTAVGRNLALWHRLGAPIEATSFATSGLQSFGAMDESDTWRHMIVRTASTNLAFAVTSHKDDTFKRVAKQIEEAVGIPQARQRMLHDRSVVDMECRVGVLIAPSAQPVQQLLISEMEDTITITCVYRAKAFKWDVRIDPAEKVLRLRALVQQKTNVPLSRIELYFGEQQLWDRHPLNHYGIYEGCIIDVKAA